MNFNVSAKVWIFLGALSGSFAVIAGAFGAHALGGKLDVKALSVYQTASQYQMFHALALVLFGVWGLKQTGAPSAPGWFFAIGTLFFSGSLYALALTGLKALGAITPLGGVLFILGWISFAIAAR